MFHNQAAAYHPVVVMCSGGADSATMLALAVQGTGVRFSARSAMVPAPNHLYGQPMAKHREVYALFCDYGQHSVASEHSMVRHQCERFGATMLEAIVRLPKVVTERSDLTRQVSKGEEFDTNPNRNPHYVPARNTVFLSIAAGIAESVGASEIWLGKTADAKNPDATYEYAEAMTKALREGTRDAYHALRVRMTLRHLHKEQIIRLGMALGVDFSQTVSCCRPSLVSRGVLACGTCRECEIRRQVFHKMGMKDPTKYAGFDHIMQAKHGA